VRTYRGVTRLPRAARGYREHVVALCEVAEMLSKRLGVPDTATGVVTRVAERWDGRGAPARLRGEEIPLGTRIVQVARDATFQRVLGGPDHAASVIRERSGRAFDPAIATALLDAGPQLLSVDGTGSLWDQTLAVEPGNPLRLDTPAMDSALAAMGDFADLLSPYLSGHSSSVAELAGVAAAGTFPDHVVTAVRRAAYVHDLGRVAVAAHIWQKTTPLTLDERERVRLHPYYTERVLARSPFLAALSSIAALHHERLDGSGYHRRSAAAALAPPARLLAAADMYQAMTSPRPHRPALPPRDAAAALRTEAGAGRLDGDSVSEVLAAAGQTPGRVPRPAGLTEREAQVIGLVAYGLPTKRIAHLLGISVKTADRHIQNAYAKIGISSRAAAALFAMEHGLATWGEVPIVGADRRS
jgi:HD-GYP domain-containing protein (c-di-GMP phosphodiesterase class II)